LNLREIGWRPLSGEHQKKDDYKIDIKSLARITSVQRGQCKAITISGSINLHLSGRFYYDLKSGADKPATGDFVLISPPFIDEQGLNAAILKEILPRRSKISRIAAGTESLEQVLVANVENAFIVTSANDDLNLNRLERYILLAKEGNVTPIVILSKIDLIEDYNSTVNAIEDRLGDLDVFPISTVLNSGLEQIEKKLLVGTTSVFLGSSGVGKSTIVNKLLGEDKQVTKEIRAIDSKGRHATTARELFFVPGRGMIIDTAGLREVQVLATEDAVTSTFSNVVELLNKCRFSDCAHEQEPGCAINNAIRDGSLSAEEYQNYLKLQKEADLAERKVSKTKPLNSKEKWRTVNKNYRARKKFEGRD